MTNNPYGNPAYPQGGDGQPEQRPEPPQYGQPSTPQDAPQTGSQGAPQFGSQEPSFGAPQTGSQGTPQPYGSQEASQSTPQPYGSQEAGYGAPSPSQPQPYGSQGTAQPYGSQSTPQPYDSQGTAQPYGSQGTAQQYGSADPYSAPGQNYGAGFGSQGTAQPGYGYSAATAAPEMTGAEYASSGTTPPLSQPLYGATMMQAYARFWKKFARFKGYASPSEFWWPYLINSIIGFIVAIPLFIGPMIMIFAGLAAYDSPGASTGGTVGAFFFQLIGSGLMGLFSLAILVPSLSLQWRRLQDTGQTGALALLSLIPVGGIIVLVLCAMGTNKELRRPEWDDVSGD